LVSMRRWREILWEIPVTILCIVCFPANPLVLTGVIEVQMYTPLFIIGWVVWLFGMVLVLAPIITFPKRGGVAKGKSFVNTTRLVDTGIYSVVRHPQYTGGIYSIFITNLLWYPHWLFALLGGIGIVLLYFSTRAEDRFLVKKFGDEYLVYMEKVPGMNIFAGILRHIRSKTD
ncbi:MAG: isoprenylcysteine carboxylmethyltransferase family protein, partial [Dehalococcoidia bacterium]